MNWIERGRRGYAIDREEIVVGMACLGAYIHNEEGRPVASISISGDPQRILDELCQALAGRLIQAAMEISREMEHFPESIFPSRTHHSQP